MARGSTHAAHGAERRQLSIVRLLIVMVLLAVVIAAGWRWAQARIDQSAMDSTSTWFAPYVDVTLTPMLHFEDPADQPARDVVLAFVVADPVEPCVPSWGTYYSLDAAARALDLDRRIVRLRERGGDAIVSFGGAINHELATICEDPDKLVAGYQAVIDRYGLTAIDFDIEGAAIGDERANNRRTAAILRLQRENKHLDVWLTLPVAPHGLNSEAVALVGQTLQAGVSLAGINVMTMNYGESRMGSMSMGEGAVAALTATAQQLGEAYRRAGLPEPEPSIWKMLGATPMIGQNDVAGDLFRPGDASRLVDFAREVGLGRLSFWSANRDVPCGAIVNDERVSNTCSGVDQEPLQFAHIFTAASAGGGTSSRFDADGRAAHPEPTATTTRGDGLTRDDPTTSPYPLWRAQKAYVEGAKVVWQARVYQAKWWTQGDQPDAPVKHAWDTPWRYLGPVLESDREAVRAARPTAGGTPGRWAAERIFVAGDQVEYENKVFRAKWWTQGDIPQEDPDQPYDHPWEYVGEAPPASR